MENKVIFLGAGASKAFGLPLTGDIFPSIMEKLTNNSLFSKDNSDDKKQLLDFIEKLYPGLDKIKTRDYPLITDTLSLIDYLLNTGTSFWKGLDTKELVRYKYLFEKALFEVLKIPYKMDYQSHLDEAPIILKKFVGWIFENHKDIFYSLISTNYDITVEQQLYFKFTNSSLPIHKIIDFGINWRDPFKHTINLRPENPLLAIHKLHGSTNWLKCNLCNHIYINTEGSIYHQAFRESIDRANTCHCGNAPLSTIIVTPSLIRNFFDSNLQQIWNNSFERLRTSSEWIIIGYSFPSEDLNIKSMFIRAFNARQNKPKITIVQKGIEPKSRYEAIFKNINYIENGIEEFISSETRI